MRQSECVPDRVNVYPWAAVEVEQELQRMDMLLVEEAGLGA